MIYFPLNELVMVNPSKHERSITGAYDNLTPIYSIGNVDAKDGLLTMGPWSFAIYKKGE